MPQQRLDDTNIDAVLQQMRGEAMPQGVWADPLVDACCLCSVDNDTMELPSAERLEVVHAREQPAIGMHNALLPANCPPLAQQGIAAENLESGSGIASRTIASLEHQWGQGRDLLSPHDVLVIDEAGMIGSRQMERVVAEADKHGAKVVLVGDPGN